LTNEIKPRLCADAAKNVESFLCLFNKFFFTFLVFERVTLL
jgi:hypothetical protein